MAKNKKAKPLYCLVSNDIYELIIRYGESLKELGAYLGVSPQYIYKMLKSKESFKLKLGEYEEAKEFKIELIP
jgi:hypothetical protein